MRVLVLGGYGLIGLAIARTLHAAGHTVTGLGRSTIGSRLFPRIQWIRADLADMGNAADWKALLANIDVVVNAAGALQDGLHDNVERVHHTAIAALVSACAKTGTVRLIQISAPGATARSSTDFMRSKARADETIKSSAIDWIILRPGLVFGPNAYGGSALIRAMAAFPVVLPITLAGKRIQVVALSDVARIVLEAVEGSIESHADVDLVEDESRSLRQIVERVREWMGFPPALATLAIPNWALNVVARVADALGYLGWRTPLRSTAVRALEDEVLGDPEALRKMRGAGLRSLDRILEEMPAGIQERWFARLYLLMPVMVVTLSAFWIVSGAVGAYDIERAALTIPNSILPQDVSRGLVVAGAVLDVGLGIAILYRPLARFACIGMVVTSAVYLAAGSFLTPALWLDPLGPFVKVLPAIVLALATLAVLEKR